MAFCSSCGTPVEGRFCAKCGTAVDAGAAPAGPVRPGAAGLTDNVASALCYVPVFITGIIFLVLAPYNQNRKIRFHAFQSIFLSVVWLVFWIVLRELAAIMFSAGILGMFFLLELAFLVLCIYLIVMTFQGKQIVLPVIGPLAQKQA
jgi:uncharacterized membrane protein